MLLLAVDTSSKNGSIALADCGPERACSVIEVMALDGGTFSAQLVPQIAALLAKHRFQKQDIGGFAVVSGPGSFTGLRIGLAAVKALAEVLSKPVAAVSLLEAMVIRAESQGDVIAVLDAGRGDVYAGEYEVSGPKARLKGERLLTRGELAEAATNVTVITNDRSLVDAGRDKSIGSTTTKPTIKEIELPRSDAIAKLGWEKIVAGETVSSAELDANYIRRSAEMFSQGKL
jgi:tRNA threonylcarbamoyladenosine biosynthesis protein TsaB